MDTLLLTLTILQLLQQGERTKRAEVHALQSLPVRSTNFTGLRAAHTFSSMETGLPKRMERQRIIETKQRSVVNPSRPT